MSDEQFLPCSLNVQAPSVVHIYADTTASVLPGALSAASKVDGVGLQLPGFRENQGTAFPNLTLSGDPGSQLVQLVVEGAEIGQQQTG